MFSKRRLKFLERYDTPEKRLSYYIRRYEVAQSVSLLWAPLLKAAQHYTSPGRDLWWYGNQTQGQDKNWMIFDTTAIDCTNKAVAKTQLSLIPPQQTWTNLTAGMDIPEEEKEEVSRTLSLMTQVLFSFINHSNFASAGGECIRDLLCGTMVMVIDEGESDEEPFRFASIPPAQVSFEESINGKIESVYRTWGTVRICDIESLWPKAVLPAWMQEATDKDVNAKVSNLVDCVVYTYGEKKPFRYVLRTEGEILFEEAEETSRWITARWNRINNEVNGRGPIIDALPSIMSLQRLAYLEMSVAELKAAGVYMGWDDGVFQPNTFRIEANTVIPIRPAQNGVFPIQPLPMAGDVTFKQMTAMDLRAQIRELLFSNPIGTAEDHPDQTATEVIERQRSFAELVGPTYSRIQHEMLGPIIQRCLDILYRKGILPKLRINGRAIQVKYQSPLAISQGMQDVDNAMGWWRRIQEIYQDQAGMFVNHIEFSPWIIEKMAINPNLGLTKEQIAEAFQAMSEKQEQAEQMEMMQAQPPNQAQETLLKQAA